MNYTRIKFCFEVTQRCNLSCRYCYHAFNKHDRIFDMKRETADQSLSFIDKILLSKRARPEISFFGGEPLLNFPLVKYITKKIREKFQDVKITIITNGTLIEDEMIFFFIDNNITLDISIDGDREQHDFHRKMKNSEGSFDRIVTNIIRIKNISNDFYKKIKIKSTFTKETIPVHNALTTFNKLGLSKVFISPEIIDNEKDSSRTISDLDIKYNAEVIFDDFKKKFYNDETFISNDCISRSYIISILTKCYKKKPCLAGRNYFGINVNGNITPCHRFFNMPNCFIGDVHNGLDIDKISMITKGTIEDNKKCMRCGLLYLCGGTCLFSSLHKRDSQYIDETFCRFNKYMYIEAINFLRDLRKESNRYDKIISFLTKEGLTDQKYPFLPLNKTQRDIIKMKDIVYIKSPNAKYIDLGDEGILYIEGAKEKFLANITTMAIWDLLDGKRTVGEIIQELSDAINTEYDKIENDIKEQIFMLHENNMLNVR